MDVHWIKCYKSYHSAYHRLAEVIISRPNSSNLSSLEKDGLIFRFVHTYELAWKVLQDLMRYRGYNFQPGPNGTMQMALNDGTIGNHDGWRMMATSRNTVSHTYDEEAANDIVDDIYNTYAPLLKELDQRLEEEAKKISPCTD